MDKFQKLQDERDAILAQLVINPSDEIAYFDLQDIESELADYEYYKQHDVLDDELDERALDVMVNDGKDD
jgi:parvulin-like peptidyl-prolyl isomerase